MVCSNGQTASGPSIRCLRGRGESANDCGVVWNHVCILCMSIAYSLYTIFSDRFQGCRCQLYDHPSPFLAFALRCMLRNCQSPGLQQGCHNCIVFHLPPRCQTMRHENAFVMHLCTSLSHSHSSHSSKNTIKSCQWWHLTLLQLKTTNRRCHTTASSVHLRSSDKRQRTGLWTHRRGSAPIAQPNAGRQEFTAFVQRKLENGCNLHCMNIV